MRKNPKNDMRKQERLCLSFLQFFEIFRTRPKVCESTDRSGIARVRAWSRSGECARKICENKLLCNSCFRINFSVHSKGIDRRAFKRFVDIHKGEYCSKSLSCWEQFVAVFLGQILKNCNSLRDIEDFLLCNKNQWHNLGIKNKISRSTLSYANKTKSYKIYEDLFY